MADGILFNPKLHSVKTYKRVRSIKATYNTVFDIIGLSLVFILPALFVLVFGFNGG